MPLGRRRGDLVISIGGKDERSYCRTPLSLDPPTEAPSSTLPCGFGPVHSAESLHQHRSSSLMNEWTKVSSVL
jgi:hypothetical protein